MQLNLWPNGLKKPNVLSVVSPLKNQNNLIFYKLHTFSSEQINDDVISDFTCLIAHYLCYKSDIILSKTDRFRMFSNVNVSLSTKHTVSDVISYCGAFGWHNIFFFKVLQSDVFVTIDWRIIN